MQELVQFLRQLGSHVESIEGNDRLPIRIEPGPIRGGTLHVGPTASSQFISALMLISPFLEEGLSLEFDGAITSAGYVMLTAHELEAWGIGVEVETRDGDITSVRIRPGMIASREQEIAPDASSAVYWAVASALIPGSNIELAGLQLDDPQPDIGVLRALQQNGVEIKEGADGIVVCAPKTLRGWPALDASRMPDGAVALSVLAACSVSNSTMSGLETLRIKESDRIGALKAELERCGAVVRTTKDSIGITPIPQSLLSEDAPEVEIKTYDDHRMAMAFSILGLRRGGLSIQDPGCTSKSYPRFFEDLSRVVG
jgi:3-phosphoshikimate 1-carboxyvinyltransferase